MDFGYGLQAADSFDKNQQQAVTADQQAQMFDWQKQKAESELENLPDKQAADKVGYQLKAAQGQSDLDVAPQVALIRKTLANTEVQNLPQTVMKMRTDSLMSTVDASHTLSAGLGKLIYDGAPDDQVVSYVNQSLQAQGKPGNVKRVGVSQNPNDPQEKVFQAFDENNNPITDLAESYVESPDRMTYSFKIRQGVSFHNGTDGRIRSNTVTARLSVHRISTMLRGAKRRTEL